MAYPEPIAIYRALRERFGFLDWWPGESDFEIFVGAILTQQTTWRNVEKAIANLKDADALSMEKIARMDIRKLQRLIRPSGYYRQKSSRLKKICAAILNEYGSLENLMSSDIGMLRSVLLSYNGIGKETADSIILYVAEKPIFVIDAYTRRAMRRMDPRLDSSMEYDDLRNYFESRLERRSSLYNDFHAQFVELGKNYCRAKPLCGECPLNSICKHGRDALHRQ